MEYLVFMAAMLAFVAVIFGMEAVRKSRGLSPGCGKISAV